MADTVIFDFGANNGDDVDYYLKKADRVVAVEANPTLCEMMRKRFADALAGGRLVIENAVLTARSDTPAVTFYIHRQDHVLSQFPPPSPAKMAEFEPVELSAIPLQELVVRHGIRHYVKIDLEHYDAEVLRALFAAGIFPDYVSAEAHSLEIFCILAATGMYRSYKLVDGCSVEVIYGHHLVETPMGPEAHAFLPHSAGPFGNDIRGNWMTIEAMFKLLSIVGPGWKDIHASRHDAGTPKIPRWLLPSGFGVQPGEARSPGR